jgi:drug/metabolite transporter (DMT)-like permease
MAYLFFVSLLWAFSFGLIKTNLSSIHPVLVSAIRLGLAMIVFLPFLRFKKVNRKTTIQLITIGAVQYGLMYIFYNYSFQLLKAYEVALFTIFTPIYVTLFNDYLVKKLNMAHLATSILAILGTAIIVQTGFNRPDMLAGFLIVQLSNICFAIGQVVYKNIMSKLPQVKDQEIFGWLYLGAAGITVLLSLFMVPWSKVVITSTQFWTLLFLGTISSGVAFFLWNYGARRTNIGAVAIFNDLKTPLSIAVSLLVFGETTHVPNLLIGGSVVVLALVINEMYERSKRRKIQAEPKSNPA